MGAPAPQETLTARDGSSSARWMVRHLALSDVRCWRRAAVTLPEGLIVVHGPNGAGKTSLIEAVVLGALGVSPRTTREVEVVRRGATALHVAIDLEGPRCEHREIGFQPGLGRRLSIDGALERSLGAWRRPGAVLVFIPEELRAVKGPPAARRRHLDRLLEAADPSFAPAQSAYQHALVQRNALLRRVRAGATTPTYGLVWFEAPTRTDQVHGLVTLGDVRVLRVHFTTTTEREPGWLEALRRADLAEARTVSVDRLQREVA